MYLSFIYSLFHHLELDILDRILFSAIFFLYWIDCFTIRKNEPRNANNTTKN